MYFPTAPTPALNAFVDSLPDPTSPSRRGAMDELHTRALYDHSASTQGYAALTDAFGEFVSNTVNDLPAVKRVRAFGVVLDLADAHDWSLLATRGWTRDRVRDALHYDATYDQEKRRVVRHASTQGRAELAAALTEFAGTLESYTTEQYIRALGVILDLAEPHDWILLDVKGWTRERVSDALYREALRERNRMHDKGSE